MRIDRLFSIMVILLNKDKVTASELAEKFEVSTRTIYRDVEALSAAGVPIYANRGSGGGIALLDNYTMSKTLISDQDKKALLSALKSVQATKVINIDTVMDKLSGLFSNITPHDWIEVDFSQWGETEEHAAQFDAIKNAILESRQIQFDYYNAQGHKTRRRVCPLKLVFKGRAWYLWAYCRLKKAFRLFKMCRIKAVEDMDVFFERTAFETDGHTETSIDHDVGLDQMVDLTLRFKKEVLYLLYDYFDERDMQMQEDGRVLLNVSYPRGEWIYGFLLSFGSSLEVVKPSSIRRELAGRLKKAIEIYNK